MDCALVFNRKTAKMSLTFSPDSTQLLTSSEGVEDKKSISDEQLQYTFDVDRTIEWISKHNFQRVGTHVLCWSMV